MNLKHKVVPVFPQKSLEQESSIEMLIRLLLVLHLMKQLLFPMISYNLIYNENQVVDATDKTLTLNLFGSKRVTLSGLLYK